MKQGTSTVTTPLTVNCNSQTTYNGDSNQTTSAVFYYQNNILWATQVNNTMTETQLSADSTAGPVTLKKGATVKLQSLGDAFVIQFTGTIVDSGSENKFTGTNIGTYPKV